MSDVGKGLGRRPTPDPRFIDLFGREREFDTKSLEHPMRRQIAALTGTETPPITVRTRHYQRPPRAYRQRGGTCVGHSFRWKLDCGPNMLGTGRWYQFVPVGPNPYAIYDEAQKHDQWVGEQYDGTSVLGAAKAAQKVLTVVPPRRTTAVPLLGEYTWSWTIEPVIDFLRAGLGCVVIGIDWLEGMLNTDENGFIHATGPVVGGHSVCLDGVDLGPLGADSEPVLFGTNSWGQDWGFRGNDPKRQSTAAGGRFKITASALAPLLSLERYGEAMTAVELSRRALPTGA